MAKVTDDAHLSNAIGDTFNVRATIQLGALSPEDVAIQAISGRVSQNRELTNLELNNLELVSSEGSSHTFEGTVKCVTPGLRGYIVRVVPNHLEVVVAAELPIVSYEPEQ